MPDSVKEGSHQPNASHGWLGLIDD
jgi:hypothetical protein